MLPIGRSGSVSPDLAQPIFSNPVRSTGRLPGMNPVRARIVARYMISVGCSLRDVAELLRAHPRAVVGLLSIGS